MDRAPTIRDVASLAKVHAATASRALNPRTRDKVSPRTVQRVVEAARTLGYAPNSAARSLRTRTSSVAGVIIPDLRNPMFPPIVRGIEDGLAEAGYMALLGNTDDDADRERELVATMRGRQTDGFILATSHRGGIPLDGTVPVVLVNRRTDVGDTPSVTADGPAGVYALVRLLHELGHRRIGHLAGPRDVSTGWDRYRAFQDAMASYDLTGPVEFCDFFTEESGRLATARLLDATPDLTAIVASNDLIALGCYDVMNQRGLRCPEDISVTGFNEMPFVDKQRPSLTTVRIPLYDLGLESARLLLDRIANPSGPAKSVVLPTQVIQRESVARPSRR
ncbi:LacI family DNA-binding transcriptional regulator [Fodinicola acaciae]|uniref:LacI family DNA-binding transcriptional regulator n=1 Tax=Fodinicola acaciae TaxID=2681555 RepID=UPI0013D2C659|nr:LacI family DNA-binding transcriptional regulator [Fodinicola acaciae]